MNFRISYTPAEGRNEYGKYTNFRKTPHNPCDDAFLRLTSISVSYSDGGTGLKPNKSNYAQMTGTFDKVEPVTMMVIGTENHILTPITNRPSSQRHYTIEGNDIYWNREEFGTTPYNGGTATIYGSYDGVEYTGITASIRMNGNYQISAESELNEFMAYQSSTGTGMTEIFAPSGESYYNFYASVTRHWTMSSGLIMEEEVTDISVQGDGLLFLDTTIGEMWGIDSIKIPENDTASARTGVVELFDEMDNDFYATIPVTQAASAATKDYLRFDILSGGTVNWKSTNDTVNKTISYSKDSGETWTDITSSTGGTSFNVNAGDSVFFKGNNSAYGDWNGYCSTFSGSTAAFNIHGNIMSLLYGDNFEGQNTITANYAFNYLFHKTNVTSASGLELPATTLKPDCYEFMFSGCTSLSAAPALPATTLKPDCYEFMFRGCTSLTAAPALPATTLMSGCYNSMFQGCTSLTAAPALPATTLAINCYAGMFQGCTSLTTAPALPATTLVSYCYSYMFYGCSSLTTAPSLPVTTLATGCYSHMFSYCASLTTAPALPATTLASQCYYEMFYGCSSLNYIKCLATDISATQSRLNWVYGVASAGTFVKSAEMTSWTTGTSGIPSGWTVEDEATEGVVYMHIGEADFTNVNIPFDVDLIWNFRWDSEDAPVFETGQARVSIAQGDTNFWGSNDYEGTADPTEFGTTKILYYELQIIDYNTDAVYDTLSGSVGAYIPDAEPGTSEYVTFHLPDLEY